MNTTDIILIIGFAIIAMCILLRHVTAAIVARVMMALGRHVSVGDHVAIAGLDGVIESIQLRYTKVRAFDGSLVAVPNAQWLRSPYVVRAKAGQGVLVRIPVSVALDADTGKAASALRRAADRTSGVARKPVPRAVMIGIGRTHINFELRAWTAEGKDVVRVKDELCGNVQSELRRSGSGGEDRRKSSGRSHRGGTPRGNGSESSAERPSRRGSRRDRTGGTSDRGSRATSRVQVEKQSETDPVEKPVPAPAESSSRPQPPPEPEPKPAEKPVAESDADDTEVVYGRSKRKVPRR